MKSVVVDVHAHFTPIPLLVERFDAHASAFPGVKLSRDGERVAIQFAGAEPRPVMPKLADLAERRAWLDRNAIDHQLLGGWVESFGYEMPPQEGLAWSRFMNDCMWETLRDERRFTPLATVPLQDGALAAEVLGEVLDKGFGGVMIGTLPKGTGGNLDDPSLDAFWESASKLRAPVVLHPMTFCGEPRLDDYGLMNAYGRLEDTSIAVSRLLFSGHLLRFPGVKLVLSMGGGTLPYGLGRLARSHENAKGKVADPRKGFETLYFDSCVFDADALEYLARKTGRGRIMLGSDAPFPMGDPDPRRVIDSARLTDEQKLEMLGATARDVFRLRAD